jgi:hypothetical protein
MYQETAANPDKRGAKKIPKAAIAPIAGAKNLV